MSFNIRAALDQVNLDSCNPRHYDRIITAFESLEKQLTDLQREYDEEVISHDLEERDLRLKISRLQHRIEEMGE